MNGISEEDLNYPSRTAAVKARWEMEKELVLRGEATRQWTLSQQAELIEYGFVSGFEGSHMMSVKDYPEYACCPENIQLLPTIAHFDGVHGRNPRMINPSGYYVEETGEIIEAADGKIPTQKVYPLKTKRYEPAQEEDLDIEDYESSQEKVLKHEDFTLLKNKLREPTQEDVFNLEGFDLSGEERHKNYKASKKNHPEKSIKYSAETEQYQNRNYSEAELWPEKEEKCEAAEEEKQEKNRECVIDKGLEIC